MSINREKMYRFPWSKNDNPGGWIEVTDECNLSCPGCYRYSLTGHMPLEEIKADVISLKKMINCEVIAIAGGEPLLYPELFEVIDFINKNNMKSRLLTNGEKLTREMANELKKAGLTKIMIHVDYNQSRPDWEGKTEAEMNELRQHYADLLWDIGGIQCGFLITIYRETMKYIPEIVTWFRKNIHKVHNLTLNALRGTPVNCGIEYIANGKKVDLGYKRTSYEDINEINITSEEIYEIVENHFPDSHPSAYLSGTSASETNKVLITSYIGSKNGIYGKIGPKTIELTQVLNHLLKGRYIISIKNPKVGKKIFILSLIDGEIRKSFARFLKTSIKNPLRLFDKIYTQIINIHQPNEIIDGKTNLCDGCINQMIYKGKLINTCRLDEIRMYGELLTPIWSTEETIQEAKIAQM